MIQKLKKVLYTVDESNPDAVVIVKAEDDVSVQAWAIARFRAACMIARGKHNLDKSERVVSASALRSAKRLNDVLTEKETSALSQDDWRIEALRSLDEADKVLTAIVRVSDLKHVRELYDKALSIHGLYCEIVFGEEIIKFEGKLGKVIIPARLAIPGRIGVSVRYLTEAIENLVAKDDIGIAVVQYKDTYVFVLASEHERHYIAEMRQKQ
jgi:hypothetical protein